MRHYLRNLLDQLTDTDDLAIELFLAWIAVMLTFLCIGMVAYYAFGGG